MQCSASAHRSKRAVCNRCVPVCARERERESAGLRLESKRVGEVGWKIVAFGLRRANLPERGRCALAG